MATKAVSEGLNGVKVLDRSKVFVGTVPGAEYGYKRPLRVTVDIRMEKLTRRGEYETIEHAKVSEPLDFAITLDVWRPDGRDITSGGCDLSPLCELATFAPGFDQAKAQALFELGTRWHLNGMRAGCAHQQVVTEKDRYGRETPSLDKTPACPETGYRYGHAWLVEELPADFREQLAALIGELWACSSGHCRA
jgi:hypothetical protein